MDLHVFKWLKETFEKNFTKVIKETIEEKTVDTTKTIEPIKEESPIERSQSLNEAIKQKEDLRHYFFVEIAKLKLENSDWSFIYDSYIRLSEPYLVRLNGSMERIVILFDGINAKAVRVFFNGKDSAGSFSSKITKSAFSVRKEKATESEFKFEYNVTERVFNEAQLGIYGPIVYMIIKENSVEWAKK